MVKVLLVTDAIEDGVYPQTQEIRAQQEKTFPPKTRPLGEVGFLALYFSGRRMIVVKLDEVKIEKFCPILAVISFLVNELKQFYIFFSFLVYTLLT